jgi:uncharacterized protein
MSMLASGTSAARPPSKPRVAVIGAGVAGISAAYHLRGSAEITLFERDNRAGGHAHTIEVAERGRILGIDTAFVVFNRPSYPSLSAFFDELGVDAVEHEGGFNFFDLDTGFEYGTAELGLTDEEAATRSPEFQAIRTEARRFHEQGRRDFFRKRTDMPLGEYLDLNGYSQEFRYGYVILLATAVWSVPAELIWEMPATTVIAFFMAHDEGGLGGQRVDWRTVGGGSISYVRRALAVIDPKLRLGDAVTGVRQDDDGVTVATAAGAERFDHAVIAAHADQTLSMLDNPSPLQQATLAGIRYNASTAVLHTDPSVLPANRDRWQSWNYGKLAVAGEARPYVAYYMNKLHGFEADQDYIVTLDYPLAVREETVIRELSYSHPVIDMRLRNLQKTIYDVNVGTRVKLCGSYFHSKKLHWDQIGSHEAAFCSGAEAAAQLLRELG